MVTDFVGYEDRHGRRVHVRPDTELEDWATWPAPARRPHPGGYAKQCCSHVFPNGCVGRLVCHGTTTRAAGDILGLGTILAATALTGQSATALAVARATSWPEPPDYFEHVMFANGSCTAPEAVALSRSTGRALVPNDLRPGYPPAVRFYFDWMDHASRDDARFDGVHPVKIKDRLDLDSCLIAVVIAASERNAVKDVLNAFAPRLVVLDLQDPTPAAWAHAALQAAEELHS